MRRRMKRFLAVLMIILMTSVLWGCGQGEADHSRAGDADQAAVQNPITGENAGDIKGQSQEKEGDVGIPVEVPPTKISGEQQELIDDFDYAMPCEENWYVVEVPGGMETYFDLDGDGVDDTLYYTTWVPEGENRQVSSMKINGQEYRDVFNGLCVREQYFGVVDLVDGDNYLELALYDEGAGYDRETQFYRYTGGELIKLGTVPKYIDQEAVANGDAHLDGRGNIYSSFELSLIQSWEAPGQWALGSDGQIRMVEEKLYNPLSTYAETEGRDATVKGSFVLYMEPNVDAEYVVVDDIGAEVDFQATDNSQWMLLAVKDGDTGWLRCGDSAQVESAPGDFVASAEVFDNLTFYE